MKKIIFLVVSFFCLLDANVKAASLCDYKEQAELNGKAANVKASYELKEEIVEFEDGGALKKYFKVSLLNLNEDFYIKVKNNRNEKVYTFKYDNSVNGVVNFDWDNLNDVTNLTIEVYSNSKTSCPDERYRTIYLTIPRYNEYSRRSVCETYSDFYLCQEFVTVANVEEDMFLKQLENYKSKNSIKVENNIEEEVEETKGFFEYINEYKVGIIIGCILVGATITIVTFIRRKKQKEFK